MLYKSKLESMKNKLATSCLTSQKKASVLEDKVLSIKEQINLSSKKKLLSHKRGNSDEVESVTAFNNIQTIPLGQNNNSSLKPVNNSFYYSKNTKAVINTSKKDINNSNNKNSLSLLK
jgi:hypothetical protein